LREVPASQLKRTYPLAGLVHIDGLRQVIPTFGLGIIEPGYILIMPDVGMFGSSRQRWVYWINPMHYLIQIHGPGCATPMIGQEV
jgi:hypothetical protein